MAFIPFIPDPNHFPQTVETTADVSVQIWQELVKQRYVESAINQTAFAETSHFVDQAKIYFFDALKSEHRSAGLLYYYSFLNLAKATLAVKGIATPIELIQTSVYHGLKADPQNPADLVDFQFVIHPPTSKGNRKNIFALLYKAVTKQDWPFDQSIQISLRDIVNYCFEISTELNDLYSISRSVINIQSLIRVEGNNQWVEMLIRSDKSSKIITEELQNWPLQTIQGNQVSPTDRQDWLLAFHILAHQLERVILLRSIQLPKDTGNQKTLVSQCHQNLGPSLVHLPIDPEDQAFWFYVPKITLKSKQLHWHPMLSDYLFSFVLSTLLRYQPYLLEQGSKNYFLTEAWCNQSPITTLRYFLMLLTSPPLRIKSVK